MTTDQLLGTFTKYRDGIATTVTPSGPKPVQTPTVKRVLTAEQLEIKTLLDGISAVKKAGLKTSPLFSLLGEKLANHGPVARGNTAYAPDGKGGVVVIDLTPGQIDRI